MRGRGWESGGFFDWAYMAMCFAAAVHCDDPRSAVEYQSQIVQLDRKVYVPVNVHSPLKWA